MLTKSKLTEQLHMLGVPQDRPVLVHSSMRAVGAVDGRAEGFLQGLIDYVTAQGGLLCIPTHTWFRAEHFIAPSADFTDYHTNLGILSDLAAQHPAAHRSLHPTHSMAVFGDAARAEAWIARDTYCETPTAADGCYGGLREADGAVLLIGVGHEKNTFIHAVEEMCHVPNRLTAEKENFFVRTKKGNIVCHPMYFMYSDGIPDPSDYFGKFEPAFRACGCVRDGKIGNASAQLCSARKMAEVLGRIYARSGGRELLADDTPPDARLWQ